MGNVLKGKSLWPDRSGLSIAELLVSGFVLVTGMGIVAQGAVKSYRLQQETRHYVLAQDEVANQMERLTIKLSMMSTVERKEALKSIAPSEHLRTILPEAKIIGELVEDTDHGSQWLRLKLWRHQETAAVPISMIGWIRAQEESQ